MQYVEMQGTWLFHLLIIHIFALFLRKNLSVYLVFRTAVFYDIASWSGMTRTSAAGTTAGTVVCTTTICIVIAPVLPIDVAEKIRCIVDFTVHAVHTNPYLY